MKLRIGVVAAAAAALVAAGCGGSAGGNKQASGGESIAPGNAVAYLSVDTDVDSAAWTKAQALLDRFPGKDKILSHLRSSLEDEGLDWETDVKPALGNETEAVFLDTDSEHVVGLTKPKNQAKFDALLAKSTPPMVSEQVDGWTVFAEKQALLDEFDKARSDNGSLGDDSAFSDACGTLPSDSIARAWARGSTVQTAFDRHLHAAGLPADATENQVGTLDALTAAVTPEADGIKIVSTFSRRPRPRRELPRRSSGCAARRRGPLPLVQRRRRSHQQAGRLPRRLDPELRPRPRADRARPRLSARGRLRAARRRGRDRPLPDRERIAGRPLRRPGQRRVEGKEHPRPPGHPGRGERKPGRSARSRSARSRRRRSTSPGCRSTPPSSTGSS